MRVCATSMSVCTSESVFMGSWWAGSLSFSPCFILSLYDGTWHTKRNIVFSFFDWTVKSLPFFFFLPFFCYLNKPRKSGQGSFSMVARALLHRCVFVFVCVFHWSWSGEKKKLFFFFFYLVLSQSLILLITVLFVLFCTFFFFEC